ncbi:YqzL family protein [Metallumcola ferriviriculae]
MMLPAEFFWRVFELTGSIKAYMIYRKLAVH